jgi:hypothetical protein
MTKRVDNKKNSLSRFTQKQKQNGTKTVHDTNNKTIGQSRAFIIDFILWLIILSFFCRQQIV